MLARIIIGLFLLWFFAATAFTWLSLYLTIKDLPQRISDRFTGRLK
jgi:hypothetical protein